LVTVLTAAMIVGVTAIAAILFLRLGPAPDAVLVTPDRFAVPDGVSITGYSVTGNRAILVGDDATIRVYEAETGALIDTIPLP